MSNTHAISREEFIEAHECRRISHQGSGISFLAAARTARQGRLFLCVVARVRFARAGNLREWTAYLGAIESSEDRLTAAEKIIRFGRPLSQCDGEHFFPRLDAAHYCLPDDRPTPYNWTRREHLSVP